MSEHAASEWSAAPARWQWSLVSIVIPARNEAAHIEDVIAAVKRQASRAREIEIILVDDGSEDDTAQIARLMGAIVISRRAPGESGSPAAARNRGAAAARGDPIVFLDADCIVAGGWLEAILRAHGRGAAVVGGSLALPEKLSAVARCDYYCGWYLIHPAARAGWVVHHPPPNLSVRRDAFLSTAGFKAEAPFHYTNEERFWQGELRNQGGRIYFEPRACALHINRPGLANLLRRNYRWGYTALEAKSQSGAARLACIYRYPVLLMLASPGLVIAHTLLITACWMRAGVLEPLAMLPLILISRAAYVGGFCVGGWRWLRARRGRDGPPRPSPRWG